MFFIVVATKMFGNFTGKHQYRGLFSVILHFMKFFSKKPPVQALSFNFPKIFQNSFLMEHLWETACVDANR